MPLNVLFSAPEGMFETYHAPLTAALAEAGLEARLTTECAPTDVDYIVFAPGGPVSDFTDFTATKAVLGLWAGVESDVKNESLTQPLARMVDPSLTQGMVEYVTGHVLRHHLGMDRHIKNPGQDWVQTPPPLALLTGPSATVLSATLTMTLQA